MITVTFDATWWLILVFITDLVIRVAAIIIVPRNRRPTAATAWLLAIYFIPFVGVLLFLLIGNPRLPRKRRRKQEQSTPTSRRQASTSISAPSGRMRRGGSRRS